VRIKNIVNKLRTMRVLLLLLLPASVILSACTKMPQPIPPGTDTYFYGYIVKGEKFGIKVGDSRDEVERKISLKKFFGDEDLEVGKCERGISLKINGCGKDVKVGYYRVKKPLRDGFIYIIYRDKKVVSIVWEFDWLPPMDF
jgi:hypothetical protein